MTRDKHFINEKRNILSEDVNVFALKKPKVRVTRENRQFHNHRNPMRKAKSYHEMELKQLDIYMGKINE